MAEHTFDRWLRAIKTVGFPVVVAMALGYAGWVFGNRVLNSNDKFMDMVISTQQESIELQRRTVETQQDMAEGQQELHELTLENTLILRSLGKSNQ
jgi:hypothetical protein